MGYESYTLPSCTEWRNCLYSVNLITPLHRLFLRFFKPRIDPTRALSGSSPASALTPRTVHRRGGRQPSLLWLSAASWCTLRWGGAPQNPLTHLPLGNPTLYPPHVLPSSSWSVALPDDGTLSEPWVFTLSLPRSCCHIIAPTDPPPCTFLPGIATLLLSFPVPYVSFPTASKLCAGLGIPTPNRCCCRKLFAPGMVTPLAVIGNRSWSETRPYTT